MFFIFLLGCGDIDNPGGVLTANQLPQSVIKFIKEENILENEEVMFTTMLPLRSTQSQPYLQMCTLFVQVWQN